MLLLPIGRVIVSCKGPLAIKALLPSGRFICSSPAIPDGNLVVDTITSITRTPKKS